MGSHLHLCPWACEDELMALVMGLGKARAGCYLGSPLPISVCSFVRVQEAFITQPDMDCVQLWWKFGSKMVHGTSI